MTIIQASPQINGRDTLDKLKRLITQLVKTNVSISNSQILAEANGRLEFQVVPATLEDVDDAIDELVDESVIVSG